LGSDSPLEAPDKVIDQRQRAVLSEASSGEEFGRAVAVGKVNGDQFADIVVTAPYDEEGGGTVSVIPGSAGGPLQRSTFLESPGKGRFGAALSLLDTDNDALPEIYVGVDGVDDLDDALVEYRSGSEGLNPKPATATGLGDKATRANETDATMYIGR
jgi:FG-GAP repeat